MDFLLTPLLATSACAALIVVCLFKLSRYPNLDHIPVAGHSSLLASYLFTTGLEVDLARLVQEGYDRDKSAVFRVANLTHWVVCFPRSDLERVARASEDHLSFGHATGNLFKTEYTFGMKMNDFHHLSLSRSHLTRYLSVLYADVRDEIVVSCNELLDPKHNEWKATSAVHIALTIVSRTSNRIVVGLPLCRDPDWLNINLPQAIVDEARTLRFFPNFMVPLVAKFVTNLSGRTSRGVTLLGPVIRERLQLMATEGTDWLDKPNDLLQWWLDTSQETCPTLLTRHMINTNFVTVNSTANILSQVLLNLGENPKYAQELRDEVEAVVSEHGWTKEALSEMRKVDSFIKETQRFNGISVLDLMRKAVSDITLADGTFIPQGTSLAFPVYAMHHDDAVYQNPNVFEPFRFGRTGNKEVEDSRYQMVASAPDMLSFGLGRHACPGRFFAATVLKTTLAHIVMSYDVKLGDKSRPDSLRLGISIVSNPAAKVMFRKRVN